MAGELRWILLAFSALLLIGIIAWGARRSRQAPGNSQLRESSPPHGPEVSHGPLFSQGNAPLDQPSLEVRAENHGWGVPPFEPLSIRTADFDSVPLIDLPMSATSAPVTGEHGADAGERLAPHPQESITPGPMTRASSKAPAPVAQVSVTARSVATMARPAPLPARPAPAPVPARSAPAPVATTAEPTVNASESQRIVTVRVAARSEALWGGATLMAALEQHGLGFGRYKVFHRKHVDGRTLFCAASLVEPGTFDLATMPEQEFRGLTLFAVLPGPLDAMQAVDLLIMTAGEIAATLHGVVQDSEGAPLTPERALALRDDVARFQASLAST